MRSHRSRGARGLRLGRALLVTLLAQAACDQTPAAPSRLTSAPPAALDLERLELEIDGPGTISNSSWGASIVMSAGEAVQLRVRGYLPDGTGRDVTQLVYWRRESNIVGNTANPVTISDGLVQSRAVGSDLVTAVYSPKSLLRSVRVLVVQPGTFALAGYILDARSSLPVSNAVVEMVGAEYPAQRAKTLENGWYGLLAIPDGAELRVTRGSDYVPVTQRVALADHGARVDFKLVEAPSLRRIDGRYTLTVRADPGCSSEFRLSPFATIPDDLRVRTFAANVIQVANSLTVELTGQTLWRGPASFHGSVQSHSAVFSLRDYIDFWDFGANADVEERLGPSSYLFIVGEATVAINSASGATNTLAGQLVGSFLTFANPAIDTAPVGACTSRVHQFTLTR